MTTVTGVSGIVGVLVVADIPAVADVSVVAGIPANTDVPAVVDVPDIVGFPVVFASLMLLVFPNVVRVYATILASLLLHGIPAVGGV